MGSIAPVCLQAMVNVDSFNAENIDQIILSVFSPTGIEYL